MARADYSTSTRTSHHHGHESGPVPTRPVDGRVRRAVRHRGQMPPCPVPRALADWIPLSEKNRGQSPLPPISDAFRGRPIFAGPARRQSWVSIGNRGQSRVSPCLSLEGGFRERATDWPKSREKPDQNG